MDTPPIGGFDYLILKLQDLQVYMFDPSSIHDMVSDAFSEVIDELKLEIKEKIREKMFNKALKELKL
jgi:hypothetical protein